MPRSHAEAAELAEAEAAGLGDDGRVHRELGALWWDKLGRLDRAVHHLRRAWEIGHEAAPMETLRDRKSVV